MAAVMVKLVRCRREPAAGRPGQGGGAVAVVGEGDPAGRAPVSDKVMSELAGLPVGGVDREGPGGPGVKAASAAAGDRRRLADGEGEGKLASGRVPLAAVMVRG